MPLAKLWKENRFFLIGFFLLAIAAILILLIYTKREGFYLLNSYHAKFLTQLFIYLTYLGDGAFVIIIGLVLIFFKKRREGIVILASYLMSGGVAQLIKEVVVEARPGIFFQNSGYPYLIEGITLHNMHAFPSGHTASAFALAATLAFCIRNKWYSLIFLSLAALVGYSRIYLAQHFMQDIFAGAVIGLMSAIICLLLYEDHLPRFLPDRGNH